MRVTIDDTFFILTLIFRLFFIRVAIVVQLLQYYCDSTAIVSRNSEQPEKQYQIVIDGWRHHAALEVVI